ncbi:hypothetical protein ACO0RG_001432 [Hanseniaspora osmophila]
MSQARRDIVISKQMSYLLRHGAEKEHLDIDECGYVSVVQLLNHNRLKSLKTSIEDVQRIVQNNDKKRFEILSQLESFGAPSKIRATQGHSIKSVQSEKLLSKVTTYEHEHLIHGTSVASALVILETGHLKKMNRNHIHLSFDILTKNKNEAKVIGAEPKNKVVSGMRYNSQVYIFLNHKALFSSEISLYKSSGNEVYLIEQDIPVKFFQKIVVNRGNCNKKSEDGLNRLQQLCKLQEVHFEICENF